jgi:hypothetical protein
MGAANPTDFIIDWLLSGPEYLRENAMFNAAWVLNGSPDDREGYLRDLMTWVGYHWNVQPHETVGTHIQALRDHLSYEDIEGANWMLIAEALVAADQRTS